MKSEKGVTLTSVMVYIIALTVVVITVGRIMTYFYKNVNNVTEDTNSSGAYISFNSYFTEEINIEGNDVEECATDSTTGESYIIFSKTGNQYTYKDKNIYKEKVKIAKNINECEISYNETTKVIQVNMKIKGKTYSNYYTVAK